MQTIDEERADEQDLLSCLQDSTVLLLGATPQDVHAYAVKYCLMKSSWAAVQLMLIEYPQFAASELKHVIEPIEKVVQLPDHAVQQQIFNSWGKLYDGIKPTTVQTPVRMHIYMLVFNTFGCYRK